MSTPAADEPDATGPTAPVGGLEPTAAGDGDGEGAAEREGAAHATPRRPVRRDSAELDEDATSRDWADTGDPAHAPDLPGGHPDAALPGSGALGALTADARDGGRPDGGRPDGGRPDGGRPAPADAPPSPAQPPGAVPPGAVPPGASAPAGPRQVVRATDPPRRPAMLLQGLWPALLAAALAASASLGLLPLAAAVLGVQVFLVLGALALLDAPAAGGAFAVAGVAAAAADVLVLVDDGRVTGLAGAAGLGLVASLVHQLSRKGRSRVTESLADTLVAVVVALAASCLLALQQLEGGEEVLLLGLAVTGVVLLTGRVGDSVIARPVLAAGSTRGWPGLLLGVGAGVLCAVLVADAGGELPLRSAALLGLVVASTVATADLAVDLGAAELRSGWRDARRVAALRPTALLLPYAVMGPVALLAGRLVLS